MNLVKLEDDLKQLPEQTLVEYVQSPQNQVPTYLVLAELERRKRMKQGAMASMQQQNTTVADRMVAEAQPQPQEGLAALPVENVGNEAAYAAGGIVAFDEGGPVQRYNGMTGSFVQLSPEEIRKLTPEKRAAYYAQVLKQPLEEDLKYATRRQSILGGVKSLGAAAADIGSIPYRFATAQLGNIGSGAADIANTVLGRAAFGEPKYEWISGGLTPYYDELRLPVDDTGKKQRSAQGKIRPAAGLDNAEIPAFAPQEITLPDGRVVNKAAYERAQAGLNKDVTKTPPGPGAGRDDRIPTSATQQGIASLYEAPPNPWEAYSPAPAVTAEDEMARMREAVGVDPFRKSAEEKLAVMESRAKEEERVAPWMALAEAGFAIAGGESPYAATNIGKGAQKGIESLAKAKERAAAAEEKRFGIEADLARAKRAEDTAIASFGFNSEQADKQRKQREELEKRKGEASYQENVANKKFDAEKFKMEYEQKDREIDIMSEKVDKQIKATTDQIQKQMLIEANEGYQAQLKALSEQWKAAYTAGYNTEAADIKKQMDAVQRAMNLLVAPEKPTTVKGNRPPIGGFYTKQ